MTRPPFLLAGLKGIVTKETKPCLRPSCDLGGYMRKVVTVLVMLGLIAGSFVVPAEAAKKKKKAKPVQTKLFFHGTQTYGELEAPDHATGGPYKSMDAKAPEGSAKSMQVINYVRGPNPNCAGNSLFPVWVGNVAGTVTGDMKVTFRALSSPTKLEVRVWSDVASQMCNEEFPEPTRMVVVDVPAGQSDVEAVLAGSPVAIQGALMVQIQPVWDVADNGFTPRFTRVYYDGADAMSGIEFLCTPASGASCAL